MVNRPVHRVPPQTSRLLPPSCFSFHAYISHDRLSSLGIYAHRNRSAAFPSRYLPPCRGILLSTANSDDFYDRSVTRTYPGDDKGSPGGSYPVLGPFTTRKTPKVFSIPASSSTVPYTAVAVRRTDAAYVRHLLLYRSILQGNIPNSRILI